MNAIDLTGLFPGVIGLEDFVANKHATGREKGRLDLLDLEQFMRRRK